MTDFPITRARERLGFTPSTSVRGGQIDTSTGGVELGKAMSRLGQTVTDLGLKYELKEANTQFSKYKSEVGKLDVMRDAEVLNAADSDEIKAIYERYEKQKEALKPTNKRASEAAGIWDNQQAPKTERDMFNARRGKTIDNERTRIFEKEQEVYTDPSKLPEFEAELARSIILDKNSPDDTGPTFTNEEAAKILTRVRKGAAIAAKKIAEKVIFDHAMTLPEKEGVEYINKSDLPLDSITSVRREYTIQKGIQRDQVTSDTIREYFAGQLTVDILNERHKAGLIRDSEFKSMMKGLTGAVREHSDPFAKGNIRRASADFAAGAITREEADKIVLANYDKLNGTDRSNVVADLEDVETKIIATAKSNAYDEGKGLMSRRFVGVQTEEDLIDLFRGAGLTEEEKARINRLFTAEVNNRDLYERAVDDRFKEMRKEGISDINKYKAESLSILLQYQRRKQLTLEELEAKVKREQRGIVAEAPSEFVGPPAPTIKPIDKMSTEEKQRELERIRELKRLAK